MDADALIRETERYFHKLIPLTRAMGISVESRTAEQLVLSAPLDLNHNHLGTAFGGSLSAIATLAGYGLLWLELDDREAHVVVRESSIKYLHPVKGAIRAICQRPSEKEIEAFGARYRKAGKSRVNLRVTIEDEGRVCVEFKGSFVAIK